MDTALRLPLELILIIVDKATQSALPYHASSLASLCLVCRIFRVIAEPVLYRVVILHKRTPETDASYSAFSLRTRALVIRDRVYVESSHLVAFRNIDVLACSFEHIKDIRHLRSHLGYAMFRPRVLVLMRTLRYHADLADAIHQAFDGSVTHLALPMSIAETYADCRTFYRRPEITHVHISSLPVASVVEHDQHIRQVDSFLEGSTVRRVVCRMVNCRQWESSRLQTGLMACASRRRDSRLAYDGAYQWDGLPEDLFLQDVLDGSDALWESGQVLYQEVDEGLIRL